MSAFDPKKILWGIGMGIGTALFIRFVPPAFFKIFLYFIVLLALKEYMHLTLPKHPSSSISLGVLCGGIVAGVILFSSYPSHYFFGALLLVFLMIFTHYLLAAHELSLVFSQIAYTLFGVVYLGVLLPLPGLLREMPHGYFWVFLLAGCTFMADSAAYFAGKKFGKTKLAPKVSPNKTVEGLVGGVLGSIFAAYVCKKLFWDAFPFSSCLFLGMAIALVGTVGDLCESLIKRSVNAKDSGQMIPGHGGLLDRIDALLFTSPFVYYYVKYFYV